ncbi:MAG: hypothetical protein JJ899_15720, partial [Alphaproteobacteria bacterium]|nr:hypothetical protein [Alphaproteobacteria bacterium]
MYVSAGTSGLIHATVVAASLFSLPAIEIVFGDVFGRAPAQEVLTYGEGGDFQSKFTSGALTTEEGEATSDETESGIDPDDNAATDSSGDSGFDEAGDSDRTDSRFGSPDALVETESVSGDEGTGEELTAEAASEGELNKAGGAGEAEEVSEPTTREIIVFVNLAPDPKAEPADTQPALREGPAETPSQFTSEAGGEAPVEVAALAEGDEQNLSETPPPGDTKGLEDGETETGRQSEGEPTAAAGPIEGELSPPDAPATFETEVEGGAPEDLPESETATLAPSQTTVARNPAEELSGTNTPTEDTTVLEQAEGSPGLPDLVNDVEPLDAPLASDAEPQPELAETVPGKNIEGFDTPATPTEERDDLLQPDVPGNALARIGGQASGLEEEIEGERGPLNETAQSAVEIAEGTADAQRVASPNEETRDGILEDGVKDAEDVEDTSVPSNQVASLDPGEQFRAPDIGAQDRAALLRGEDDPLAEVIASIAGNDEELARVLIEGQVAEPPGGRLTRGQLRINDVLEQASEAGLARAKTLLAKRYLLGLIEGREPEDVVELLRNAAERGDEEAQLLLGVLFADGRIVPKDLIQSHVFFELAANQGNEDANDMLPVLERQMEPREVVDSRRLAREYRLLLDATADARSRGTAGEGLRDQLLDAAAAGNTAKIAQLLSRGADLEGE